MRDSFQPCVYLLANRRYGAIYCGVTSNLLTRLYQHREEVMKGFTSEHAIKRLVWHEQHGAMETAILREKRIKKWLRQWKINLIEANNPEWRDLAADFGFEPHRTPTITRHPRVGGDPTEDSAATNGRKMDSRLRGKDDNE